MIRFEDVFPTGKIIKPHGIEGEMLFEFKTAVFDTENAEYLLFDMDGILVPFFIESYRFISEKAALMHLEDVDTDEKARIFSGKTVYLPNDFLEKIHPEDVGADYFIGFDIADEYGRKLGTVIEIDESTQNMLFVLRTENGSELLIPANDDLVRKIDHDNSMLYLKLPEGLLDI
ncbi:MAG: ribosome maturation factor RimM [Prevotellaceae bacterium]|jgi:16S rRNA processing protein RimM|nr:ribosome maturation factor RimM [Prevotellaceae bacterium]